jgi:hypothetical protein
MQQRGGPADVTTGDKVSFQGVDQIGALWTVVEQRAERITVKAPQFSRLALRHKQPVNAQVIEGSDTTEPEELSSKAKRLFGFIQSMCPPGGRRSNRADPRRNRLAFVKRIEQNMHIQSVRANRCEDKDAILAEQHWRCRLALSQQSFEYGL